MVEKKITKCVQKHIQKLILKKWRWFEIYHLESFYKDLTEANLLK